MRPHYIRVSFFRNPLNIERSRVTGGRQMSFRFLGRRQVITMNSRLTSLTSICCEILEHTYSAPSRHLESHSYFLPYQHGFRKGFSCDTQLASFTFDIS